MSQYPKTAWYSVDVDRAFTRFAYLIAFVCALGFGWQARENHRQLETIASQARTNLVVIRMLDERLDSIAMGRVLVIMRSLDARLADALLVGGSVAVDSILRKAEDK